MKVLKAGDDVAADAVRRISNLSSLGGQEIPVGRVLTLSASGRQTPLTAIIRGGLNRR